MTKLSSLRNGARDSAHAVRSWRDAPLHTYDRKLLAIKGISCANTRRRTILALAAHRSDRVQSGMLPAKPCFPTVVPQFENRPMIEAFAWAEWLHEIKE